MNLKGFSLSAVIVLAIASPEPTAAAPVTFTIDPARSAVSFSGNLTVPSVGTFTFKTQGAGSLTTSYAGSIVVELAPPNIILPGGSDIRIETNGTWQPAAGGGAGSAPAAYGGEITPPFTTSLFAGRNIQFDVTASAALLSNGVFNATNLIVTYLTNATPAPTIDYRVTSSVQGDSTNGTSLLTGSATNVAIGSTLSNSSGELTLTVPVNVTNNLTIGSNPSTTILSGQIVATAPASAWPLLIAISLENGKLTLSWPSLPGQSFTVQTTQNIGQPWSPASGTTNLSGSTTTWTANSLPNSVQFYRVIGSF